MKPYRTVRHLAPVDRGYIAGLIDGEGTVTLSRKHANDLRHVVVSISNTEHELLDHVLALVGCGKITNKKTAKPNHALSMTYAVYTAVLRAQRSIFEAELLGIRVRARSRRS